MYQLHPKESCAASGASILKYREQLRAEQARLQRELGRLSETLHGGPTALADQAPLLHDQFVSICQGNFSREKLRQIQSALERIERGEYGACEECNELIAHKRLRAVPWARYCIHCQESTALRPTAA